jgi:hypothetical protein
LKIVSNGYVAGIFGVVLAHVIADYIAASLDPHLNSAAIGIVIGGLLPLSIVPLMEEIVWLQDKGWLRGAIFGFIHTLIPLIGFYSGWSINRLLKIVSNGYIAGIIGVIIAHVIADYIAAILDPN